MLWNAMEVLIMDLMRGRTKTAGLKTGISAMENACSDQKSFQLT